LAQVSRHLAPPRPAMEDITGTENWGRVNPCDHEIHTPYSIGDLTIAAMNCTQNCPMSTYPDNRQVCHACPMVGCNTCAEQTGCKECLIFHVPISFDGDGQCLFIFGGIFVALALLALCLCLCGVLRFCCLGLMSPRSPGVLKEAISHRRRAKVHDYSLPGNPFYAYDDTNVRRQNVSGVATMLYFRFVAFVVILGLLLCLALASGALLRQMVEGRGAAFLPELIPVDKIELVETALATAIWAVCFLATIRWVWDQSNVVRADGEEEPHLRNYSVVAEGFPKSARSPHEVKTFFESILGFEIEGVSVAYDHVEEVEFVQDRVGRAIEKADTHLGVYPAELSSLEGPSGEAQDGYVLDCLMCSGYAFVVFSREEDREFCLRRFADIERLFRQGSRPGGEEDPDEEEAQALLTKAGPGRGRAARPGAGGFNPSRAVLFRGKFPIRVGHAPEPCGIQWHNFAVRRGTKLVRVAVMLLGALLLVMVLGAVMFAPAVLYEMSYVDLLKPSRAQLRLAIFEQTVVVVSTAAGNRLLIAALRRTAELSGFLQKVNEDCVFAACALCVTLVNSVVPLVVASAVAAPSTTVTRALAVQWLFQTQLTCMLITEVAGLLAPVWSYWSGYFWVRQSMHVAVRDAEPVMTSTEFPLATRYVDLLHMLTLDCAMIALDSASLFTVGAQCLALLYSIFVYFMDKYTFLRLHRNTYYTSPKLAGTMQYFFVIPLAVLSVLPLQHVLFKWRPWISALVFVGCALLFLVLVRAVQSCNQPRRELTEIPYVEVASLIPYNYFNTNPVHVLRSLHFPSLVVPPIYPFAPGKEYLQGGQFADYDDSIRLRETLMLMAKNPLKGTDDLGNPQDFG